MDLHSDWALAMGNQTASTLEDALGQDIEVEGEGNEIGAA